MVEMDPASDFDILEYLDHVDNVAMYRQLATRIDKYYRKATRYIKNGKITARPNWIVQEVEKRGSKGEKFWQSYKAVCRVRFVDNVNSLPVHNMHSEVAKFCITYFSTAVTNNNISAEDRPKLLEQLRRKAPQLQALSATRTIPNNVVKRPSIVRLIFAILFLPIGSLLLLSATSIYITFGAGLFIISLVLGPLFWLFNREDYSPIEITKTFMAAAWGYIKVVFLLDTWKEEWKKWDDYLKSKE